MREPGGDGTVDRSTMPSASIDTMRAVPPRAQVTAVIAAPFSLLAPPRSSAYASSCARGLARLPIRVLLRDVRAFVVVLLALADADLDLDAALLEVELERHRRRPLA